MQAAVGYLRVSTREHGRRGFSLETQGIPRIAACGSSGHRMWWWYPSRPRISGGLMAYDELDELLAALARERAVIDHNELEAHGDASAECADEDYTATDHLDSDERSL